MPSRQEYLVHCFNKAKTHFTLHDEIYLILPYFCRNFDIVIKVRQGQSKLYSRSKLGYLVILDVRWVAFLIMSLNSWDSKRSGATTSFRRRSKCSCWYTKSSYGKTISRVEIGWIRVENGLILSEVCRKKVRCRFRWRNVWYDIWFRWSKT